MSEKQQISFARRVWAEQRSLELCKPSLPPHTYYDPNKPNMFYTPRVNKEFLSNVIKGLFATDKKLVIADIADSLWLHEFDYEENLTEDMFIRIIDVTFEQLLAALYTLK